jgi:hypothetical protein
MRDFDFDSRSQPAGGRARHGGAFYHVSFRSGSRAGGACAASSYEYITREGEYAADDRDPATFVESGHMPEWAQDEPREYWDAADLHERANGRLFVSGDVALPRGLSEDDQIELAREFVSELTDREHLPYTFAIHAGRGDGGEHNPHVHVMISERQNDGIGRDASEWFRRANRDHPEQGGAPKSREFHGREWVEAARQQLADRINQKLEALGREERVDHRSYDRQVVEQEPGEHFGPGAAHLVARGYDQDRLTAAAGEEQARLAHVNRQIEQLERVRDALLLEGAERDSDMPPGRSTSGGSWASSSRDEGSRGR